MQEAKVHICRSCFLVALCCNLNLQAKCPDDRLGGHGHLYEPKGKKNIYSLKSLTWPAFTNQDKMPLSVGTGISPKLLQILAVAVILTRCEIHN